MNRKYSNRSKIEGKIGTENFKVSNCPVHLPKENLKFFKTMQDAGNKDPFDINTWNNQVSPIWKKSLYERIINSIRKGISNAINESRLDLALDDYEDTKEYPSKMGKYKDQTTTNDILLYNDLIKKFNIIIENSGKYGNPIKFDENDIRTFQKLYQKHGLKYKVYDSDILKAIIEYSVDYIDGDGLDLNWLDVSSIEDFSYMFEKSSFNGDISEWDVSHATTMAHMFDQCAFNGDYCDLDQWDVSNVLDMQNMFSFCPFDGDISMWRINPDIKDMSYMFQSALNFDCDLSNWELNLETEIRAMFKECGITNEHKPKLIPKIIKYYKEVYNIDVSDEYEDDPSELNDGLDEGLVFEGECGNPGGAFYNTPMNTIGVGNVVPAGMPAMTGAEQASDKFLGSGDLLYPESYKKFINKKSSKKRKKKAKKKTQKIVYFPIAIKK